MARTASGESHQIQWVARAIRRAAADRGVGLPIDYSNAVAADGLSLADQIGVTPLGEGVVVHTTPSSAAALPIVLGYADRGGQWHRDGRRHQIPGAETAPVAQSEVAL